MQAARALTSAQAQKGFPYRRFRGSTTPQEFILSLQSTLHSPVASIKCWHHMFLYTVGMFHMHYINPSIICWVRVGGDLTARCKQETTLQDSVSPFLRVKLMLLLILLMRDHEMPRDHRLRWREAAVRVCETSR